MTRTVLVTGANRGIGLAVVTAMATNSNDKILLGCRNLSEGKKVASKIGNNVEAIYIDLSSLASAKNSGMEIQSRFPQVDVLINNAAVLADGSICDVSSEKIMESLLVNTFGPIEMMKIFLPRMIQNNYGRIINVSSGWGAFDEGLGGPFSYSVSKCGLNAATLAAARNLPSDVKVNSACPGWVRTRMGGMMATKSPEEGAETIIWLANIDSNGPSGGFFRDKQLIEW